MSDRLERAASKALLAAELAGVGGTIGGPVGAAAGAVTGLIIGDHTTVFPMDMVAIPAYQAYMITGTPAFQIYIKEGEVLTQVQPTDAEEATAILEAKPAKKKRRKKNPWVAFNKKFKFRDKRKRESSKEYFRLRQKAARIAYNKMKKGVK